MASDAPDRRFVRPALAGLALLSVIYLATVLPALGNDPIIGGDEGWIMSASAKLSQQGEFGSDLFQGFFGADRHYFFNLPLHHIVLAGVFEVFGVGITQARLVSVIAGLLALGLTFELGRRVGGDLVGLGAAALLVLLRLNLAPFSGLTLTDLGATVRYDLPAVPYALGAVLLIALRPRSPTPLLVAAAGLLTGLGVQTQFIAGFVGPPIALYLLSAPALSWSRRLLLTSLLTLTALLSLVPYGAYILAHRGEFEDQSRSFDQRSDFTSPSFLLHQLRHEPHRYAIGTGLQHLPSTAGDLLSKPSSRLTVLVLAPLAFVYSVLRARGGSDLHRLLALLLACLVLELALFESTKRYVYTVVLVPFLCVALADMALAAWRWQPPNDSLRTLARAGIVSVTLLFAVEGLAVAAKDVLDAGSAPGYKTMASKLQEALPEDAIVIGDNRLWPALGSRERSLLLLFYFTNPRISREQATDIPGAFESIDADYLLLSPLSRQILTGLSPQDSADFEHYLSEHGQLSSTVDDAAYGPIEVWRLK